MLCAFCKKNPGQTLVALLSLALGIGATTAIFSVIYRRPYFPLSLRQAESDLGSR